MRKLKVLLITNIIPPYRIPLYNCLNSIGNFNFKVIALAEREANREWQILEEQMKFEHNILPGFHRFIWSREIPIHVNKGLWQELRRYKPDVVITSGYDAPAYWEGILYCKAFKKKYILWNGTTLFSTRKTGGISRQLKRIIIKAADQYVSYGTKAAEYLLHMGAPRERIHVGLNAVDVNWFRRRVKEIKCTQNLYNERARYPEFLMLYVGQLIERKGVTQVLRALHELRDPSTGILVLGAGPQADQLKVFCRTHRLRNVYFKGFQQQEALPKYYAIADVLILPSFQEVWGLVVNEALASGLFVLCSDRAGAAHDLIKEGWNGVMFDSDNVRGLARLIQKTKDGLSEIRERREAISGHACREFTIERSAEAFLHAIEKFPNSDTAARADPSMCRTSTHAVK